MSIISYLLRAHVSRRAQRKEAKREWENAAFSPQAIRSRRYRRVLTGVLVLIGTIAFVEVVLVPGSMIRRNLVAGGSTASATPAAGPDLQLPAWLMTEDQKSKLRQQDLQRIEQNLRATHLKFGNACLALSNAHDSLVEYSKSKLQVVPAQRKATAVAPGLVDVLANEPTAQVALARILQVSDRANSQLRDAREQLALVASRFAANSFLADDDHDMNVSIQQLEQTRLAVEQARSSVDHIVTLQRARAALDHQATLDANKGNPK